MVGSVLRELRERWFVTMLSAFTALFFTAALVYSASTYVGVMDAGDSIALTGAYGSATVLENGSLAISFDILFENPSKYDVVISTLSWNVKLDVSAFGEDEYISLGSYYTAYVGLVDTALVPAGETEDYSYGSVVSDPETIAFLQQCVDEVSSASGTEITLETAPYIFDFRLTGWLAGFEHDYQYSGEFYLNDMVEVEKRYYGYGLWGEYS